MESIQFVLTPVSGRKVCWTASREDSSSLNAVLQKIHDLVGIPPEELRVRSGTKDIASDDSLTSLFDGPFVPLSLSLRLLGGKGGFGSLLRGGQSGPGQKKTENFGSMRDLQGRRIRDVEQAKKLQDALARKNGDAPLPVDDDPVGRRGRKKSKKSKNSRHQKPTEEVVEDEQEKKVKLPPAVVAEQRYGEDRKEILDKVADSLQEGLKRAKELAKLERKAQKEKEKKSVWGDDDLGLSLSDDEESGEESESEYDSDSSGSYEEADPVTESNNNAPSNITTAPMTEENTKKRPREEDASISTEPSVSVASQAPTTGPIDLTNIESAAELEKFGLEHLKQELMRLGMICGGDLKQRAERLFRVKGKSLSEIDPALLVANRNKKRKV